MSTAMNFGTKTFKPRPPEKGAFPLDHLAPTSDVPCSFGPLLVCSRKDQSYNNSKGIDEPLRDKLTGGEQLMAKEPLEKLGFRSLTDDKATEEQKKL
ncbi:cytochrome c oxidase assembly protein COX19 [Anomaloglossus baeobatrachus]|uniref:cytochrome c oxidase assembly protein COX19 n=1 Tax=Anomaloglossus baeobatrachus TaxID=238106 RepID=UPI003F5071C6